jgi:hypothetical protein
VSATSGPHANGHRRPRPTHPRGGLYRAKLDATHRTCRFTLQQAQE